MNTSLSRSQPESRRGSILIVALVFAAIIAISLTSYIKLATTASQLSYRSLYAGVSMNAAETGLEEAMWSINKLKAGSSTAWDGWDISSGTTARRTFTLGNVDGGGEVVVKVLVSDRTLGTSAPFAIARSIVTPIKGNVIEKWIKISLSQRALFSNGLVAKNGISFSGNNAYVDSYNSSNGDYTPGSTTNRFPRGSAGSSSVTADSLSLGNADIYGYASIGSSDYSGLRVGSQGKVTGDFNAAGGTVDYSRVATSFTANFDEITAPTTTSTNLGSISTNKTLPVNTASDAKITAADGTVTYYYSSSGISLNGSTLTISPGYNVVLTVNGSVSIGGGGGALNVSSTQNTITGVKQTGKLDLYVSGNLNISGQGTASNTLTTTSNTTSMVTIGHGSNAITVPITTTTTTTSEGQPQNLMIWGTNPTAQNITITGNGSLSAVVYAPHAAISAKGGGNSGSIFGAFVGDTVRMTGNDGFHYDEALKALDSGEPLGIDNWDEYVSVADRNTLGNIMDF
jgi:hypothetical protein